VFSTPGNRPAITGTYSLPRRRGISRALYMASTRHSRRNCFPISPHLEHRIEVRASRRELVAQSADFQRQAVVLARSQAKLRQQREHHIECLRDLETRLQEGETVRHAVKSRQIEVSESLHRLAQAPISLIPQTTIQPVAYQKYFEGTRDAHKNARRQLARAFRIEKRAAMTSERPRMIAKMEETAICYSRLVGRHRRDRSSMDLREPSV